MIYVNGELVGRTEYEYDNESSSQILLRHHDRYFLKDHLSNVRVTLKDKRNEWRDDFESETSKQFFLSKHSANTSSPYSEFMEDPSDSTNQVLRLRSNSNSAYTSYVLYVAPSTEYRVRVRVRVNDSGLSHGGIVRTQYDSTNSQISGTWIWTNANLNDIGNWQDVDFTFTTEPNAYKVQFFHGMNHYASGTEKSIDFDNIEIIEVKNEYKLQEDFTASSGWSTWLAYGNTHPNAVELTEEPGNSSNDIVILRNNTGTTNYSYLISSIKPETRYRIRYRLKRVNSASHYNCVYFNFIDDNGNGGDYYYIASDSENPEWQTQSREFVSPAIGDTILNTSSIIRVYNGDGIRIHARIHSSDPGGNAEVWFDDIELEEIRDNRHEVIAANDYYPYGMTIASRTFSGDPEKDKFKFQSKERDAETGYDYFEARLYDSDIGRFLHVDPKAEQREWLSPYNFVQNNPLSRIDPDGALDYPIIRITKQKTGGTAEQRVLGYSGGVTTQADLYKVVVTDTEDANFRMEFSITRDAWTVEQGNTTASNVAFEPKDGDVNHFTGKVMPNGYPQGNGTEALKLTQYDSEVVHAEPNQTSVNMGYRDKADVAAGVMIHVGGNYEKNGKNRVAASAGCFGIATLETQVLISPTTIQIIF